MITQLEIKLKYQSEEKLNYNISSVMHGILMGHIDRAYGERMHEDGLKPFVQEVCNIKEDEFIWRICTMTEEAKIQIIEPLMKMDQFYFEEQPRNITIKFCSPTAFKSQGNYIFMPTVRLIFQSLIHKYDTFSSGTMVGSEETLEHIERYVMITRYHLRSVNFSLEGVRIPAFVGTITIRVKGPQQLVNLIKMLAVFGQYSAVGIKTALGMGRIQIEGV